MQTQAGPIRRCRLAAIYRRLPSARVSIVLALAAIASLFPIPGGQQSLAEQPADAQPQRRLATPAPAAALTSNMRAVEVLRRALLSTSRVAFSGEQTVLTFDADDGSVSITNETHLDGLRYRIACRYPSSIRGGLQLADGRRRTLYLPSEKTSW